MAIERKESCGNVFRDMGFSEREADNLKLRAEPILTFNPIATMLSSLRKGFKTLSNLLY